ncbi:helix-turn-helix domain-containing protein, partial [Acinetobacter soli]
MGRYTLEFKLSVVEYFLSGQGGQKATAKRFGTNHSAVRVWVAAY